jgi:hypothetical protein
MISDTLNQTETRKAALDKLKEQGWSVRQAAEFLGYSLTHLRFSLDGRGRPMSRPMFEKIMAIPKCDHPRWSTKRFEAEWKMQAEGKKGRK